MDQLTRLPDELLIDIVERVHAQPPDVLPALGLTCKRLQRLCRPILWKGVVVPWRLNKNAPIANFLVVHTGNEDIRSIRLCPQRAVLNAFKIKMKNAYDHVDGLYQCLSSLPSLETFSIYLNGQIDGRCALPGPVLARIVRALPPTLRNLELDTECTDEIWEDVTVYRNFTSSTVCNRTHDNPANDPTKHLCHAISERVPHLETLNLRLSCICPKIFLSLSSQFSADGTQPKSTLRRALITLDISDEAAQHSNVHVEIRDCFSAPPSQMRRANYGATTLETQRIFKHLLELQAAGAFPDLQRFIVFSWNTDVEFPTRSVNVRDVATRTVTKFPKMLGQNSGTMWDALGFDFEAFLGQTTYLVRAEEGRDFVGSKWRLQRAALHEVTWREAEDSSGVRTPPNSGTLKDETVKLRFEELVDVGRVEQAVGLGTVFPHVGDFKPAKVIVERL